jgi:hypothetical protein
VYIVARVLGRVVGVKLGVGAADGLEPDFARSMGWALMPQAGVALGMALVAVQRFPEFERYLSLVIAATVVFEMFGPVLTRRALVRMGEVNSE